MPCMTPDPTPQELRNSEIARNKREYGIGKPTNELIADLINMNCEMSKIIMDNSLDTSLDPQTKQWIERHQKRDKEEQKKKLLWSLKQKCELWSELKDKADFLMKRVDSLASDIETIKEELGQFNES